MKTRRILLSVIPCLVAFILLIPSKASAQGKEVVYIFFYADVESEEGNYRYFSTILDQPVKVNEKCLMDNAKRSIEIKAGNGAKIGKIEIERSHSFQEAEELILHKYTTPDRKVTYFQVVPDC